MAHKKNKKILSGIYGIHNKVENKYYIGKSVNIVTRLKQHKLLLNKNEHTNRKLQLAWNEYGEDSFELLCLEECSKKLEDAEQRHIEKHNAIKNGYNNENAIRINDNKLRSYYINKDILKDFDDIAKKYNLDKSEIVNKGIQIMVNSIKEQIRQQRYK